MTSVNTVSGVMDATVSSLRMMCVSLLAAQFDQHLAVAPSCGVMLQFVTRALSFLTNVFSSSIYTAYECNQLKFTLTCTYC